MESMKRDVKQLSLHFVHYLTSLLSEYSCPVRVVTWRGREGKENIQLNSG